MLDQLDHQFTATPFIILFFFVSTIILQTAMCKWAGLDESVVDLPSQHFFKSSKMIYMIYK
jgi:hypothetical protein